MCHIIIALQICRFYDGILLRIQNNYSNPCDKKEKLVKVGIGHLIVAAIVLEIVSNTICVALHKFLITGADSTKLC